MWRRLAAKLDLRDWLQEFADRDRNDDSYGVGEYDFEFPLHHVKIAWQIFRSTGRIPSHEEVMAFDPRWTSDVLLMEQLFKWFKNKSAGFKAPAPESGIGKSNVILNIDKAAKPRQNGSR